MDTRNVRKCQVNGNMDMLSTLPDVLLILIISLLPFKQAVRTSILSKRWLFLYRGTDTIVFNETDFVKPSDNLEEENQQRQNFIFFANSWVINSSLNSVKNFGLKFSKSVDFNNEVDNYISFASNLDLKVVDMDFTRLSIHVEDDSRYVLPTKFYENQNLETLQLYFCEINTSKFTNLKSLQNLYLVDIKIDSSSLKLLLGNCLNLITLSLKQCWELEDINISAKKGLVLRNLMINDCVFDEENIKICAPNLHYFKYTGQLGIIDFDGDHEQMIEAEFDYTHEDEFYAYGDYFYGCLQSIRSIRILTLCGYVLQVLPTGVEAQCNPPLKVEHLVLNSNLHQSVFLGITFMLKSCPLLKNLVIRVCPTLELADYESPLEDVNSSSFWTNDARALTCISNSLQGVTMHGFTGTDNEFQFLRYVIQFGRGMEILNIELPDDGDQKVEIYKARAELLCSIKRASPRLIIRLYLAPKKNA